MNLRVLWIPSAFLLSGCSVSYSFDLGDEQLPDPLAAGWNGEAVCEQLHEDDNQRVLRCTFPPGVGHERHFHAPHVGYVLAGGKMRIEDERGVREVNVAANSSWVSDGIKWHEALNVGDTTTVFLIIE